MQRTTIYLPESLKRTLARAAHEEGRTEADLIREGLQLLLESRHAKPKLPLFKSGKSDLAENLERDLDGFGER